MKLEVYHTHANNGFYLGLPIYSTGVSQWLGDGYYFWQDYEFADWWGKNAKCRGWNRTNKYIIYKAELVFDEDEFIDTVFNEDDYYNFVKSIEKFAKKFQERERRKPTLEEFNLFISAFGIWDNIHVIRFQDVPQGNIFVAVKGFYYKKRIQIRINSLNNLSKFVPIEIKNCKKK